MNFEDILKKITEKIDELIDKYEENEEFTKDLKDLKSIISDEINNLHREITRYHYAIDSYLKHICMYLEDAKSAIDRLYRKTLRRTNEKDGIKET